MTRFFDPIRPFPVARSALGTAFAFTRYSIRRFVADEAGMVARADGGRVLARALDGLRLIDLYRALGLPLASALSSEGAYPWEARIASALQKIAAAETASLSLSIGELVGAGAPVSPFAQSTRHRR